MQRNIFECRRIIIKFEKALNYYSTIFNNAPQKEKYLYLSPLRKAGLTRTLVRKLGYNATTYMWKNCMNDSIRSKGF